MTIRKPMKALGLFLAAAVALPALALVNSGAVSAQDVSAEVSPALLAAARKEGNVVFYGGTDANVLQQIQESFEKRYSGIRVSQQRLPSGPQRERIEREVATGNVLFDVSQLSDEAWVAEAGRKNFWAKLDPKDVPNLAKIPAKFQRDYYAISAIVALAAIYNTEKVKPEELKSSDDLLNPKWRGRFGIITPATGLSIRSGYYAWIQKYGESGFEKFMTDLFALKPRVLQSGSNGTQLVAAGEIDFVLLASAVFASEPRKQGAPVAVAYPDPTAGATRTLQVARNAKNPNAALVFLNWLMSPDGLLLMNGNEQAASPFGKTPTALELPDTVSVPDPDEVARLSPTIQRVFTAVAR